MANKAMSLSIQVPAKLIIFGKTCKIMGLDISIETDIDDKIFTADYHDSNHGYFNKHNLSRTFCNFMCRRSAMDGEPELDQIGRITAVDILPIYQMEEGGSAEELGFFLEVAESEEERQQLLDGSRQKKAELSGNIDNVLATVNALIEKLSVIDNLPTLLDDSGYDTLRYDTYFTDFNTDKGDGYIGNNFGQDLRNFKRFLEFAKERGATMVRFNYG
jgi:hypothetical protein